MGKINTFDIEIQIDEIVSVKFDGEGSDWVNDWETDEVDDDDADCTPD